MCSNMLLLLRTLEQKQPPKKINLKCYFVGRLLFEEVYMQTFRSFPIYFFSSFDSLFHTLPPLSLTLTRIWRFQFLPSFRASPKPLVPSWHSALPVNRQTAVKHSPPSSERSLLGACDCERIIYTYSAVTDGRRCLSLSMCSKASCVNMSSLSNVKRSCVRKESDPLTPAGQFPPAGCWETDQSDKRRPPSPSPLLLCPACRPLQDIVTLFCRVQQV